MNDENVISWNIPNFVTFVLMLLVIWVAAGIVSHMVFRKPGRMKGVGGASNGDIVAAG